MSNLFKELIGQQLSSVVFIQDYLQLDFDGNKLTCYKWPIVYLKRINSQFGELEYRNYLCSFISKIVDKVLFIEGQSLSVKFSNEESIEIDLKDLNGEAFYYTTPEGEWFSI